MNELMQGSGANGSIAQLVPLAILGRLLRLIVLQKLLSR